MKKSQLLNNPFLRGFITVVGVLISMFVVCLYMLVKTLIYVVAPIAIALYAADTFYDEHKFFTLHCVLVTTTMVLCAKYILNYFIKD